MPLSFQDAGQSRRHSHHFSLWPSSSPSSGVFFANRAIDQPAHLRFIGQGPGHGEDAGASLSQFLSSGFNVALRARTDRQLSAVSRQRFGDGLSDLSVAAHARHYGHFAFKSGRHVIHTSVCLHIGRRIDFSSIRLAAPSIDPAGAARTYKER